MRMKPSRLFCLTILLVSLSGCASGASAPSSGSTEDDATSVRKVVYSQTPEMKQLAERARRLGNEVYPKILTLFEDDTLNSKSPRQFDIIFKKRLKGHHPATTKLKTIYLSAESFVEILRSEPSEVDGLLIHEMAHVAQQYRGFAPIYWPKAPFRWEEGMADYVRYKLGDTNSWSCPQCSVMYPHYKSGYWCAGAFLLYVDNTYGSNVIRRLNVQLRGGSYSDGFFAEATGKSLQSLWAEFQKTSAFTPIAGDINKLGDALGREISTSRRDLYARFETYLHERRPDPLAQMAREYLLDLSRQRQLPGCAQGGGLWLSSGIPDDRGPEGYPVSRTFYGQKWHDATLYHYLVVRASKDSAWILEKVWQTRPDGQIIHQ